MATTYNFSTAFSTPPVWTLKATITNNDDGSWVYRLTGATSDHSLPGNFAFSSPFTIGTNVCNGGTQTNGVWQGAGNGGQQITEIPISWKAQVLDRLPNSEVY